MTWGKNRPKQCAACKKIWFPTKDNRKKCPRCGAEVKGERGNKFGAKRVEHAGRTFDSKFEAAVWSLLCLEERGGRISLLVHQPCTVFLGPARTQYRPDFRFIDTKTGETYFAEAKGVSTQAWRLKLNLWRQS